MEQVKEKEQINIKAWLSRAYKINEQILSKEENIAFWRTLAERATSNPSEPLGGGSAGQGGRVETYSTKIADALRENEARLCKLINTKREIEYVISLVTDTVLQLLLEERYINWKSWGEIANALRYDEVYTKKELHNKALKSVELYILRHIHKPYIIFSIY